MLRDVPSTSLRLNRYRPTGFSVKSLLNFRVLPPCNLLLSRY
jgi:hypothetical protein